MGHTRRLDTSMDYGKTERLDPADAIGDEADRHAESVWPVVIRPQPMRLSDLEARIASEPEFARVVVTRPAFAFSLARAVMTRDPSARLTWGDVGALAKRLVCLAVDATTPSIT